MKIVSKIWSLNNRSKKIGNAVIPFLNDGERVLDFGCGNMSVTNYISSRKKVDITGLDTVNFKDSPLNFVKYDGGRLPFKDNHFDSVICSYVLHHTVDPYFYVKELKRVSQNKLIILEDIYNNRLGKFLTYFLDWLGNKICNHRINVPFNFLSMNEWKVLFKKLSLKLVKLKRLKNPLHVPVKNYLMVLTV